jgi:hypothetical protein
LKKTQKIIRTDTRINQLNSARPLFLVTDRKVNYARAAHYDGERYNAITVI